MKKHIFKNLIFITIFIIGLCLSIKTPTINAQTNPINEDGKWEVDITKDIAMGGSNFSDTVVVEKIANNYYLTFSILDINAVSKLNLILGNDKVGCEIVNDGIKVHYTFSISESDLTETLKFRVFINAMKTEKEFGVKLNLNTARKLGPINNMDHERPARFVPTISISSGNVEMKKGSYYKIVKATATINGANLNVNVNSYFIKDGEKIPVKIEDDRFMLENVGEYHVVYTAETDKYLTNLGNKSKSIVDIKITSKLNLTNLAKVENLTENNVLPNDVSIQATKADINSDTYQKASNLMVKVADNFEVMSITLFDIDGNMLAPNDNYYLYLLANSLYDRNKIRVFHINDDNTLTEIKASGYGRYVRIETNLTGDFIIAEDGLAFVMPMWGIATITIIGGLLIITGIVVPIVVILKKKKKQKLEKE